LLHPLIRWQAASDRPLRRHWMGTDRVGMDVFSCLISAARIDAFISLSAATVAMAVGTTLGLITGYRRSFVTDLLIRVSDLVKSFSRVAWWNATVDKWSRGRNIPTQRKLC